MFNGNIDDNIILQLNTQQTLESTELVCGHIRDALVASDKQRQRLINYCQQLATQKLETTRHHLTQDPDNYVVKKTMEAEDTKVEFIRPVVTDACQK
jgi:hypothetical protein